MTYTFNCTLVHISSAVSTDHITIRLDNGVPVASYNLGYRTHQIAFRKPIQVNDGNYHKLRFNRFGQNSTLQLDSNWTVTLHPKSRSGARLYTVFNSHSHIRLGGVDNQQQLLNYDAAADDYSGNYDEPNQRPDSPDETPDERLEESGLRAKNNDYASNQIVNSLSARPSAHSPDHFVGVMMNVLVNGFSMLDMAAEDNPNVILSGDVHLLLSLPKSSTHHHRSPGHHHRAVDQLSSYESNYIKQQRDLNHYHLNHHRKAPPPLNQPNDLLDMMQGDQPAYAERSRQANKLVRVNNDHPNEKRDKSGQNNGPNNQNYEGDDLIFSGSGCFDDEDECANYADAGSGYDDLITPVYVPIKPKPNSKAKSSSNKSKPNKPNQKQRPKCTPPAQEADQAINRVPRTEDDEDDDTDDDDCEFEGSGAVEAESSANSEETTERTSNSADNQNGELYPYQLSTTEQSNVINRVTVDDDDRSILFTSQPIPPPASELEKIIESTTRRPLPPKRPGGHIEIVMLPLPSETATPKSSLINRGMNNKENRKMSGIQITGLSPNDINLDDDLDASFDDGLGGQGYGRDQGLSETGGSDILGGAIHINRNLIDFKFNKNSADRTALLIAAIAILIIIIVIIAPIVVFVKMRLRISRNGKLAGVPITTAQLSPAYQATNKSYASLAASGSMMVNPLGAPLGACNPAAFASNPNFHSNMHLGSIMPPNLTLTQNPVYGTIDSKAPKLPNKKDINKEWYV